MLKVLLILLFAVLAGCTSNQIKTMNRVSGSFKILGSFEVDVNSREVQSFKIDKPEKPSFWSARSDGTTQWAATLCFDNVDTLESLPYVLEASIAISMTIGGKEFVADTHDKYPRSNFCWWSDESSVIHRQGWGIRALLLPPEADFKSSMNVMIQFLDDKDSVLANLAKKYSKPHLIISTGD